MNDSNGMIATGLPSHSGATHLRVTWHQRGGSDRTLIEFVGEVQNSEAVEVKGRWTPAQCRDWYLVEMSRWAE